MGASRVCATSLRTCTCHRAKRLSINTSTNHTTMHGKQACVQHLFLSWCSMALHQSMRAWVVTTFLKSNHPYQHSENCTRGMGWGERLTADVCVPGNPPKKHICIHVCAHETHAYKIRQTSTCQEKHFHSTRTTLAIAKLQ